MKRIVIKKEVYMKYKEIVEQWNKSREENFKYKNNVGNVFIEVYQVIANKLGYKKEGYLNDYMKVYPITEINEEKMSTTSYSLQGAITYEKFGWSALLLQINTNSAKSELRLPKGFYRFVFYIKRISDKWYFFIDDIPYENEFITDQLIYKQKSIESCFCSSEKNYILNIEKKIFKLIETKPSWDNAYIDELNLKFKEIQNKFCKCIEVHSNNLKPYSKTEKVNTDLGYLSYELHDWILCSISLLLELNENIYPKVNYVYSFYLKKYNGKWNIKLEDEEEEYVLEDEKKLLEVLNKFSEYKDTFNSWLISGVEK